MSSRAVSGPSTAAGYGNGSHPRRSHSTTDEPKYPADDVSCRTAYARGPGNSPGSSSISFGRETNPDTQVTHINESEPSSVENGRCPPSHDEPTRSSTHGGRHFRIRYPDPRQRLFFSRSVCPILQLCSGAWDNCAVPDSANIRAFSVTLAPQSESQPSVCGPQGAITIRRREAEA